jgi:hypothetical protein
VFLFVIYKEYLVAAKCLSLLEVFKNHKNWFFNVKFVIMHIPLFNIIFMYIQERMVYNICKCFLEMMNFDGNTRKWVISKKEAT